MDTIGIAGPGRGRRVDRGLHLRRPRSWRRPAAPDVLVLPTAAAYQHPERRGPAGGRMVRTMGGQVEGLMVLDRASAEDPGMAAAVRRGPVHLSRRRLAPAPARGAQGSAVFEALRAAWAAGAVVAGLGAGAMVLTDPMVDPRGGALTVGLGLVDDLAVVPHFGDEHDDAHGQKLERTVALAPRPALPVVGLPARTALIRDGGGRGAPRVPATPVVFVGGAQTEGLGALDGAEAPEPSVASRRSSPTRSRPARWACRSGCRRHRWPRSRRARSRPHRRASTAAAGARRRAR